MTVTLPIGAAFADREKNRRSLVSDGGEGGSGGNSSGCGRNGDGGSGGSSGGSNGGVKVAMG